MNPLERHGKLTDLCFIVALADFALVVGFSLAHWEWASIISMTVAAIALMGVQFGRAMERQGYQSDMEILSREYERAVVAARWVPPWFGDGSEPPPQYVKFVQDACGDIAERVDETRFKWVHYAHGELASGAVFEFEWTSYMLEADEGPYHEVRGVPEVGDQR